MTAYKLNGVLNTRLIVYLFVSGNCLYFLMTVNKLLKHSPPLAARGASFIVAVIQLNRQRILTIPVSSRPGYHGQRTFFLATYNTRTFSSPYKAGRTPTRQMGHYDHK